MNRPANTRIVNTAAATTAAPMRPAPTTKALRIASRVLVVTRRAALRPRSPKALRVPRRAVFQCASAWLREGFGSLQEIVAALGQDSSPSSHRLIAVPTPRTAVGPANVVGASCGRAAGRGIPGRSPPGRCVLPALKEHQRPLPCAGHRTSPCALSFLSSTSAASSCPRSSRASSRFRAGRLRTSRSSTVADGARRSRASGRRR